MEVMTSLKSIFENYLGKNLTVTFDSTFDDLNLDSLDAFDIMTQIEEKFGISFYEDFTITTIGGLILEIEKRIAAIAAR